MAAMAASAPLIVNDLGTRGEGGRLLVLLHGYGADEHDLAPVAPFIDPEGRFHTVCPRAPVDIFPYGAGWYERDPGGAIPADRFLASVDAVDATIDAVCAEHGLERSGAVVIGFSQGGAMALASSLRRGGAGPPAAVACLSGMLARVEGLDYAFELPLPPILVQHGIYDPLVTIDRGRTTHDTLTEHGADHIYREYPMQHEITGESILDLASWLDGV
jgi:phospholipase/carboxylesterase